jgi:phosphoribosylamine--glycine ligase
VVLPVDKEDAHRALEQIMVHGQFGSAGDSVVIEEYMDGNEISVLTFSDGKATRTLPPGQDHKRAYDGDCGPNTGGMGVYAPVPFVSATNMEEIERLVLQPTFRGLEAHGRRFVGMLFTGVMLTTSGPKVIEYNARFGDPETQALMLLLKDTDLAQVLLSCTNGSLSDVTIDVSSDFACNVTVAAGGYPLDYRKGAAIVLHPPPKGKQALSPSFYNLTDLYLPKMCKSSTPAPLTSTGSSLFPGDACSLFPRLAQLCEKPSLMRMLELSR